MEDRLLFNKDQLRTLQEVIAELNQIDDPVELRIVSNREDEGKVSGDVTKRDDLIYYSEALRLESESLIQENRELRAKSRQLRAYSNSLRGRVKGFSPRLRELAEQES